MPENNNPNYQNSEQDRRITNLEKQFSQICHNYNEEIGGIKVDIAEIKTNQKLILFVVLAEVAGLIGLLFK